MSKSKAVRLLPSALVLALAVTSSVAEAAPKSGGGECRGKAFSELEDEDLCEACGGKWVVDEVGCGGMIVTGGLTLAGALAGTGVGVGFGAVVGLVTLAIAADECQGQCEAKAG